MTYLEDDLGFGIDDRQALRHAAQPDAPVTACRIPVSALQYSELLWTVRTQRRVCERCRRITTGSPWASTPYVVDQ